MTIRRAAVCQCHRGAGLIELVVSMGLAGIIGILATGLLIVQARLAAHAAETSESLDAVRVAAMLLPLEVRAIAPHDVHAVSTDSAAFRTFRGVGQVCGVSGAVATIAYRGLRDPDPAKDSVLIASVFPERAAALASYGPGASSCVIAGSALLFDVRLVADSLALGDAILLYETGSYHLSGGALRYRAPGGTRQPITADVLSGGGFALMLRPPPAAAETLAVELGMMTVARSPRVVASNPGHRVRVLLLNASAPPDSTE